MQSWMSRTDPEATFDDDDSDGPWVLFSFFEFDGQHLRALRWGYSMGMGNGNDGVRFFFISFSFSIHGGIVLYETRNQHLAMDSVFRFLFAHFISSETGVLGRLRSRFCDGHGMAGF